MTGLPRRIIIALAAATVLAAACDKAEEKPRRVSFETADRGKIFADLYGKGPKTVILAHGAAFLKESWNPLAQELARNGYRVLAINFRGYGRSVPGMRRGELVEDIHAAVRFLEQRGAESISIVAASMGGGAAARAAVRFRPGQVDKLILLSPVPVENPAGIRAGSILFVASRDEELIATIEDQYGNAPEPKELLLFDGSAHAQHIFDHDRKKLTNAIVSFLALESPAPEQ